jgi:hypothetical protein
MNSKKTITDQLELSTIMTHDMVHVLPANTEPATIHTSIVIPPFRILGSEHLSDVATSCSLPYKAEAIGFVSNHFDNIRSNCDTYAEHTFIFVNYFCSLASRQFRIHSSSSGNACMHSKPK